MPPPHIIKQQTLIQYASQYGLSTLVETGTYYGDMVEALKPYFEHIYSIELSTHLCRQAQKRFAGDRHITIIHGDSGTELGKLVPTISVPTLFWLDGHYSAGMTARGKKDTPIFEELTHIFQALHTRHVVIIDDARCFGTDPGYPSMGELEAFTRSLCPGATIEVDNDSIRITPPATDDQSVNDIQPTDG